MAKKKEEMPAEEMTETQEEQTPAEESAENQPTPEQMLMEHLKPKEGENLHSLALSRIQDLQDYKDKNDKVNQKLMDAFENNPEYAQMTKDILSGVPVHMAIARNIDMEAMKPQEGDEDFEDYQAAIEKNKQARAEKDKYLKDMEDNIKKSAQVVDKFVKDNNLTDQEGEDLMKQIDEHVTKLVKGDVSPETLMVFYKGLKRDADVEDAKKAGEIEGKNAKIEAQKEKEDAATGDGLPSLEAQQEQQTKAEPEMDNWSKAMMEKQKRTKR